MRELPSLEAAIKMSHEVPAFIDRRTQPGASRLVEDGVEHHHPLDHASLGGGLPKAIVGPAYGRPQRLVVDVEHATTMELPRRDRRREPPLDQRLDEVCALLAVDDARAREAAVLALDEDTGVQENR